MKKSIFVSYSHRDKWFAKKITEQLSKYGIEFWIDEAELELGDSLFEKIGEGLNSVDFLGVVLSSNSVESEWVKKEISYMMSKELKDGRVKVLPLLIDDCDIPWFLEGKLFADFRPHNNFENAFNIILKRLGVDPHYPPKIWIEDPFQIELVKVTEGKFTMGIDSNNVFPNCNPEHEVYLSSYYISKYPINGIIWDAYLTANSAPGPPIGSDPIKITWPSALRFCEWLSNRTDKYFSLPTEAEWEKAARGSDGRTYPWGDNVEIAKDELSPYGVAKMCGGISEWCLDWFEDFPYKGRNEKIMSNPGRPYVLEKINWNYPPFRKMKSFRGGNVIDNYGIKRPAKAFVRFGWEPLESENIGFRIVFLIDQSLKSVTG